MGHPQWRELCPCLCKPLTGLTVAPDDGGAERYGKAVSDLQSNVAIASDGDITGTLSYVTGYTGFSGDASEQEGNYLALKVSAEAGDVITASIGERTSSDIAPDGFIVIRLTSTTDPLKVTVTHGTDSSTKEFDLTGLTLEEEE